MCMSLCACLHVHVSMCMSLCALPCTPQAGTDLALGEETSQNGLQVSLLKRLHARYERYGMQSSPFEATLITEHCSHPDIVKFVGEVFYNVDLQAASSPGSTHPNVAFPLVFVCCGVEEEGGALMEEQADRKEAEVMLEVARGFAATWPEDLWGKKDLSEMCIMAPTWNQVGVGGLGSVSDGKC